MSKKLLLADDSVVIQKLVGLSFANEDFEIVSTDNGDDAVSMAREIQPDVVLADVVMPGLSGYEVCEAIRQDPALAQTPVLLLTGTFEAFDEDRASAAGANGQITKPFEAQALVERVNEVMSAPVAAPETPAAPADTVIEATATPIPPVGDADETIVTSLGSTPESADLFGANDGSLGADAAAADASFDITPQLDPNEESSSQLFGAPGDGAADVFDQSGGSMALGQAMSSAPDAEDATIAVLPNEGLPPIADTPAAPASEPLGSPTSPTSAASSDPFERPAGEETPADPLPTARPVDLDAALDAVPIDEEPTILVATDDINATTSPNLGDPLADLDGGPPTGGFEDLTVHVPSADIDQDGATAPTPDVMADTSASPDATRVADLDAALANEPIAPVSDAFGVVEPPAADATADPDATIVQIADDPVVTDDPAVEVGPTAADPLGLAPANASADDMDFAFDVSEQVAADQSQSANPMDDSFSSLMDISESAILRADGGSTPTQTQTDEAPAPPTPAAETIVAGYDVSSSDIATATAPDAAADATPPPVPEPEPLIEVPELPQAYQPEPATDADAEPITGSPDLFDDLATGSALDEVQSFGEAQPLDEAPAFDTFSSAGDIDPGDAFDAGTAVDPGDTFGSAGDPEVGDDLLATELSVDLGDESDAGDHEPIVAPIEVREADEAFSIGSAPSEPDADRPIADLSPIMEQRIHETLEKVAWEAFSDLSESIVKQVIGRVEQIAWEVIPEMAETLVREEIRKMKGDDD